MCVACWPGGKHPEAQVEKARNQHCHFVQVEKCNTTKTQELFLLLLLLVVVLLFVAVDKSNSKLSNSLNCFELIRVTKSSFLWFRNFNWVVDLQVALRLPKQNHFRLLRNKRSKPTDTFWNRQIPFTFHHKPEMILHGSFKHFDLRNLERPKVSSTWQHP